MSKNGKKKFFFKKKTIIYLYIIVLVFFFLKKKVLGRILIFIFWKKKLSVFLFSLFSIVFLFVILFSFVSSFFFYLSLFFWFFLSFVFFFSKSHKNMWQFFWKKILGVKLDFVHPEIEPFWSKGRRHPLPPPSTPKKKLTPSTHHPSVVKARPKQTSIPTTSSPTDTLLFHQRDWIDVEPGQYDKSCFGVSKKMIRLLRHDPSALREEEGAVKFRILAPMFRSKFASSQ